MSRGNETVTASDPAAALKDTQALAASDPKIITSVIGKDDIHLYESKDHHGNWLECIKSRREPIAPVEVAHRAFRACSIIAMKANRKLHGIEKERFKNDDAANALLSRRSAAVRWTLSRTQTFYRRARSSGEIDFKTNSS